MKSLDTIISRPPLEAPRFAMDHFQKSILERLHLEFFFDDSRFLITPELGYLITGQPDPSEEEKLQTILEKEQPRLEALKEYLIYNLSLYSALLETNSYFITLNKHVTIARFLAVPGEADLYELKLYTISKQELQEHYKDKIYIGRDYISLGTLRKDHFGLKYIRDSLHEQLNKLRSRVREYAEPHELEWIEHDHIREMEELAADLAESANKILESFPVDLTSRDLPRERLIEANVIFRDIKHVLFELEETTRDLESRLFEQEEQSRAVRYVTKFRKDITNDINYITMKVNGRISDHVNGIHF